MDTFVPNQVNIFLVKEDLFDTSLDSFQSTFEVNQNFKMSLTARCCFPVFVLSNMNVLILVKQDFSLMTMSYQYYGEIILNLGKLT